MLTLRPSKAEDAHHLIDIDLKCFDYPWTPDEWRDVARECIALVATWHATPIGMAVVKRTPEGDVEILKVAVKAPYRNYGLGRKLLWECILYARDIGSPRVLMLIPESRLRPGDPDDLSMWLTKHCFKAGTPLLKNHFHFYGQDEDGVPFALTVPHGD